MLKRLSINQMLLLSHLFLVAILVVGMSYSRYHSEWQSRVNHRAELAEIALEPFVRDMSGALAGRNYAYFLMPSTLQELFAINGLQYLEVTGHSDYSGQPVGIRYLAESKTGWRTDVKPEELSAARRQLKTLTDKAGSARNPVQKKKIAYLTGKAREDVVALEASVEAVRTYTPRWQFHFSGRDYYLDESHEALFIQLETRNQNGGSMSAVFDAGSLYQLHRDVLKQVLHEAIIALVISLIVILAVTRRIVAPLKELAGFMNNDVGNLSLDQVPGVEREDEIGQLARAYTSLMIKVKTQIRLLKKKSDTDTLTRLGSRYLYSVVAEKRWNDALSSGSPAGLLIIDIDNFKPYNDSYGHATGDEAIKQVAGVIRQIVTPFGQAFRIGGEEFVGLLIDCDEQKVNLLAEQIRKQIFELGIRHLKNEPYARVTVSIGVTTMSPAQYRRSRSARCYFDAFERADTCLYQAKHSGRNRVSGVILSQDCVNS